MAGPYDRNREQRGGPRWRDDDDHRRENFGRGQQAPRDDRGRFMSEGENRDYYGGGRQYGEYGGSGNFGGRDFGERDYEERGYEGARGGRRDYRHERDDDYRGDRPRDSQGGMYGRDDYGDDYGDDRGRDRERERDEYGRFTRDDERSSRGSYDDREPRGRGSGQGRGWFGDSEGHAEAARERWSEDDYRGARGGRMEMNRGNDRERDDRGRFASDNDDQRGRGERRGGEDHRGWFGDPRGHAEAARLGWRHRR